MSRCCSNKSCACVIAQQNDPEGNPSVLVTGTGTTQDPYRVKFGGFAADDSTSLDMNVVFDPTRGYVLTATFAGSSKLDMLGDVQAGSPSNGQVLAWNTSLGAWVPVAPTTAAAGTVHTDTSLTGDGSVGTPLSVLTVAGGGIDDLGSGLTLVSTIVNQLVRVFTDDTARATASPAVTANTFSVLNSDIGRLQFWSGTAWVDLALFAKQDAALGADLLQLSGPGTDDARYIFYTDVVDTSTDVDGLVVLISASDLTAMGAAGIKSLQYTPMVTASDGSTGAPHVMQLDFTDTTQAGGVAYALDGTGPLPSSAILGSITAVLYAS